MQTVRLAYKRFHDQKQNARKRGIRFEFTFEQWCAWWEAELGSDWLKKRGKYRHQYHMARLEDRGAYSTGNVKCALSVENCSERRLNGTSGKGCSRSIGSKNFKAKLTEKDVINIRKQANSGAKIADIAIKYKVCAATIYRLRRHGWGHVPKCG